MPDLAYWQWLLGAFCALLIGVAKTGVPGVFALAVPLMVLVVGDARLAAAWSLPVLCTADIFAVSYWWRKAEARQLFSLLPWVVAGMLIGAAALSLSEHLLRRMVGVVLLVMLAIHLFRRLKPHLAVSGHAPFYGVTAGFATTVANAAGPVMSMYLLSKGLGKEQFVATGAWFFFVVNLTKIPIYWSYGLFSRSSLIYDLCMVPVVVAGAMMGRWILRHIRQDLFEMLVIGLAALSSLLLFR